MLPDDERSMIMQMVDRRIVLWCNALYRYSRTTRFAPGKKVRLLSPSAKMLVFRRGTKPYNKTKPRVLFSVTD